MKLLDILKEEINYSTYEGMVQVIFDGSEKVGNLAETPIRPIKLGFFIKSITWSNYCYISFWRWRV